VANRTRVGVDRGKRGSSGDDAAQSEGKSDEERFDALEAANRTLVISLKVAIGGFVVTFLGTLTHYLPEIAARLMKLYFP
jgi:hypothetical protein